MMSTYAEEGAMPSMFLDNDNLALRAGVIAGGGALGYLVHRTLKEGSPQQRAQPSAAR